jgi:hypothetical protein
MKGIFPESLKWLYKDKLKLNAGKIEMMILTHKISTNKDVIKISIV